MLLFNMSHYFFFTNEVSQGFGEIIGLNCPKLQIIALAETDFQFFISTASKSCFFSL